MKDLSLSSLQVGGANPTLCEEKKYVKVLECGPTLDHWISGSRRLLPFLLEVGTAAVMLAFEGLVRRITLGEGESKKEGKVSSLYLSLRKLRSSAWCPVNPFPKSPLRYTNPFI